MKSRFLALVLFFAIPLLASAQTNKIKVLIIEGVSNHDWRHRVEIVRAILAEDGSFDVDVTVTPSVAGDPAWAAWRPNFSAYDVVMSGYNNLGGKPPWPAEVQTAFQNYLSSGGGFYVYHEANNSFAEWEEYNKMIGLGWRNVSYGTAIIVNPDETLQYIPPGSGSSTSHGARVNVLVKRLGAHPIHQGLPTGWMAADIEIYRYARGPATNVTVLSYALDPTTSLQFPIEWVAQYGQGFAYVSSYGHVWSDQAQPDGTRCAAFQTLMVRALKWLAGRDPGTTVPADFPTTSSTSLRPYEEGVSGLDTAQAVGPFNNGLLPSQSAPPGSVLVQPAFTNIAWESPIEVKPWPNSTDLLIAELDGRIYRVADDDTTTNRTLMLDIQDRAWYYNWNTADNTSKHGGLQSIVFHPRFGLGEGKDFIYVFYLHNTNDVATASPPYYDRLSRFTWNPTNSTFNPASELIMIQQHDTTKGHDGGGMAFGPDGFLYIAYGDEGIQGTGATPYTQILDQLVRSGVWRLDVDQQGGSVSHPILRQPIGQPTNNTFTQGYYIPNSNPWQDPTGGTLEEYYALGLRQPHRMSFDPVSGLWWIGDVGHGTREEVDVMDGPGLNFQWNYLEGTANGFRPPPSPLIGTERLPIYDYSHSSGNDCVIGGFVYRGSAIPWLVGRYVFGDNGSQRIYAIDYDPVTKSVLSIMDIGQGRSGHLFNGMSSIGYNSQNELFILQLGAGVSSNGTISRLKPNPSAVDNSQFPETLSATGLFTDLATLTPAPGLIPFEVNMPLWSSGTDKQRWLLIPNDGTPNTNTEQIAYSETGPWALPQGSVLVKQFNLPNGGPRLETRVLIHGTNGGWGGVTYKWLTNQTDAVLLAQGGTETHTIAGETFSYLYPSRGQCNMCHTPTAGHILGLRTRQLNRRITYPATGRIANQVETLSALGFMATNITEVDLINALTSASRDAANVSNEHFVRSYLDANCSQCHQPGGNQALFDARLSTPLAAQNLLCGAVIDSLGIPSAAVIKPGLLSNSVMFHRLNTMTEGVSMPPLAKGRIDQVAVSRFANWVLGMDADSCLFVGNGTVALGNGTVPGGSSVDSWNSNMVINETDTYTNSTAGPLTITLQRFQFHATRVRDPITPFVVRINGDNNFIVLAVGASRSNYIAGANDFPFADTTNQLTLAPGEKIGIGFLDALANGTGGTTNGAITYLSAAGTDQIHYSGGTGNNNSGSVTVGLAPVFGTSVITTFGRNYYFTITFSFGTTVDPDSDDDNLPDTWELAYTTDLNALSASADFDGDGVSDGDERASGTNPLDAASVFQLRELRPKPDSTWVLGTFDSIPGRTYRVWVSPDLNTWTDMGTLTSADWPAATTEFAMDQPDLPAGSAQKLFMRVSAVRASP